MSHSQLVSNYMGTIRIIELITGIHFSLDAYDQLDIMIFTQGNLAKIFFQAPYHQVATLLIGMGKMKQNKFILGIYFYRQFSKNITKKMMLIK